MDVNGARCWVFGEPAAPDDTPWPTLVSTDDPDRVAWKGGRLQLVSQMPAPDLDETPSTADALVEAVPAALDSAGGVAWVESDGAWARMDGLPDAHILDSATLTGLCIDVQGILTVCDGGVVRVRDSRTLRDEDELWRTLDVPAMLGQPSSTFTAWRCAPAPEDGAWVLDRADGQLVRWSGRPLRRGPDRTFDPGTFRPLPEDPETIRVRRAALSLEVDESAVALAVGADGRVAVLTWRVGEDARIHVLDDAGDRLSTFALTGLQRPVSVTWVDADRLAVLAVDGSDVISEALVYRTLHDDPEVLPVGDRYPLRRHDGAPWLVPAVSAPMYGTEGAPRELHRLSLPRRAAKGSSEGTSAADSGAPDTCWHRLYLEAVIPTGCGIRVWVAASDTDEPPDDAARWFPHDFGIVPDDDGDGTPRGTWVPRPSELPGHSGTLDAVHRVDIAGLFTALVQRRGFRSGNLVGRFAHIRVDLHGTGRHSPELAALRLWGPRYSYVRRHLPELYHEDPLIDGSEEEGDPTAADFLERFTALFEGVLTPLEDTVAHAWQWTHPQLVPASSLDWLASWTGVTVPPTLPEVAKRRLIAAGPELARWRGTRRGIELALELATGGGVTRGDVRLLEDWRLRRTWATILGADLSADEDPLLGGLTVDTNSIVGDTLVLGAEYRQEFLALYGQEVRDDAPRTWREYWLQRIAEGQLERFFDDAAWRVSVLVHAELPDDEIGHIRAIVEDAMPSHVTATVRLATRHFIVGVSALVGVDTRLGAEPAPPAARLGHARIGDGARVRSPAGLHPDAPGESP